MWQIDVVKSTMVNANKRKRNETTKAKTEILCELCVFFFCHVFLLLFPWKRPPNEQVKRLQRRHMISLFPSSTQFIVKLSEIKQKNKNAKYAMCVFGAQFLLCDGHCVCVFVHIPETISIPMLRIKAIKITMILCCLNLMANHWPPRKYSRVSGAHKMIYHLKWCGFWRIITWRIMFSIKRTPTVQLIFMSISTTNLPSNDACWYSTISNSTIQSVATLYIFLVNVSRGLSQKDVRRAGEIVNSWLVKSPHIEHWVSNERIHALSQMRFAIHSTVVRLIQRFRCFLISDASLITGSSS